MRNVLTNVIGAREALDVAVIEHPLLHGELLLMSSDGLHGCLDRETMEGILASGASIEVLAERRRRRIFPILLALQKVRFAFRHQEFGMTQWRSQRHKIGDQPTRVEGVADRLRAGAKQVREFRLRNMIGVYRGVGG